MITAQTIGYKLRFLTVSNRSGVVIDLNVGHPHSLWPADELTIANDELCPYDRFRDGLLQWTSPCDVVSFD